ncbi:putative RNA-directed DNA polymerase [Tanacetum coccineum]
MFEQNWLNSLNFFDNNGDLSGKTKSSESNDDSRESNRDTSDSEDSGSKSQRPDVIPSDKAASDLDSFVIQQKAATFDEGYSTPIKENNFIQQDSSTLGDSRIDHLGGISTSEDISDNVNTLSDDVDNVSKDEDFGLFGNIIESAKYAKSKTLINKRDGQSALPRRSSRKTTLLRKLGDYVLDKKVKYGIDKSVNYANLSKDYFVFATSLNKIIEPKTYLETASDHRWVKAMNLEMEALSRNNAWILNESPNGRKPIGCNWMFKAKYRSDDSVERFKARLVAKGYNQKEGIDYEETFSQVVKIVTLGEDVYMKLPEGYFDINDNRVCKLTKSLYGLKQTLRKWNEKLTSILKENGFEQSKNYPSLFIKSKNGVLIVYVDDTVVTGNNIKEIEQVKQFLSTKFLIKDLGKLKYFLGIEVLENESGVCLTQKKYCLGLLAKFEMLASKPCNTLIEYVNVSIKNKLKSVVEDKPLLGVNNYQKLVGKLIYLTLTRLDLCYAVHYLSQVMHSHLKLAFRVLRYLKDSLGKGITFKKNNQFDIKVFVDSDWEKLRNNLFWQDLQLRLNLGLCAVDKIADGTIRIIKVKYEENVAAIFTKGLGAEDHKKFCDKLKLKDLFQP